MATIVICLFSTLGPLWCEVHAAIPAQSAMRQIADSLPECSAVVDSLQVGVSTESDGHTRVATALGIVHADVNDVYRVLRNYLQYVDFVPHFTQCAIVELPNQILESAQEAAVLSPSDDCMSDDTITGDSCLLMTEIKINWLLGGVRSFIEMFADSAARVIYWRQIAGRLTTWEGVWRWEPCEGNTMVLFATRFHVRTLLPGALIQEGSPPYPSPNFRRTEKAACAG